MFFQGLVLKAGAAFALILSLTSATPSDPKFRTKRQTLDFDYTNDKVRGVSLGGWFVLEPWITPSIFSEWADGGGVVDEYTFCQTLGYDEAFNRLNQHWSTFITEDDFNQIGAAGLNHVRIPIGYWAINPLEGDPYVQGQLTYLDQSIGWARNAGLKIMIDLHGAPGSQNGADNSGRAGAINWGTGDTIQQTLDTIRAISERYATDVSQDTVTAIQLLNEPRAPPIELDGDVGVKLFDYNGWGTVRDSDSATVVCIHDAFQGTEYWQGFMNQDSGVWDVMLDTHQYQVFTTQLLQLSAQEHVQTACDYGANNLRGLDKWTIVGEWSGAATDCAMWLNGLGKGASYDGSLAGTTYVGDCSRKNVGTVEGLSDSEKDNLSTFIQAQMDAYEQATGWIFWTWKTESAPEWNFQDLLANGLIPQPITSRQNPNQCGY
ncbi:MAG: exo-1,3-beta-glucanase [Pycnora praestabilis]|nr:MAG: exo-1,3-beta-glucanase [Pycnora praestabilis]